MSETKCKPYSQERLKQLIAECLDIPVHKLDPNVPLVRYGIDSMANVSIKTAIAEEVGFEIPEILLFQNLSLVQLNQYFENTTNNKSFEISESYSNKTSLELMLKDSILPIDIQPAVESEPSQVKAILLTGVTGELGIHLLQVLLQKTQSRIYCLIRAKNDSELNSRIHNAMERYGFSYENIDNRVIPIRGDICLSQLGISKSQYDRLARKVDVIYHSAASINWSLGYSELRDTNVFSVLELLRLSCLYKKKHFIFVSSLSACYAYGGSKKITENDETLPLLSEVHLGYAQTKIIAESLIQQAHSRGLKTSIHRPSLILGNSITGHSNPDDIISRLIKGCIKMGYAPDLRWTLDACSVDYIAEAIYVLSNNQSKISHLLHPHPRQWQELVLWMNLSGYPVNLVPYDEWIAHLRNQCKSMSHPLYSLRPFFLNLIPEADGLSLPQVYEDQNRSEVTANETTHVLSSFGIHCPHINSRLLERYFQMYIKTGYIPDAVHRTSHINNDITTVLDNNYFSELAKLMFPQEQISSFKADKLNIPPDSSIIAELASWRTDKVSGLFRYMIHNGLDAYTKEVFIKVKPSNTAVTDVAQTIAKMCDTDLGKYFCDFKRQAGLIDCHKRELAIYQQKDERFLKHSPKAYWMLDDDDNEKWILALEAISKPVFSDTTASIQQWKPLHIQATIRGLAQLHSIWYCQEKKLLQSMECCDALSVQEMEQAKPLWHALAKNADRFIYQWLGASLLSLQENLISTVGDWWYQTERMHRTLIHNDFNPRNIMLVGTQNKPKLCAFDWELGTLGLPQHDLIELLCFVLPPSLDSQVVLQYVELHRQELQYASGISINRMEWNRGIQLSLYDIIINRIPMYALVHRIKPQSFLPRVTKTWQQLYNLFTD